jgi:hypothetical protein
MLLNARECGLMHASAGECTRMRFFWFGVDVALT